MKIKVHVKLQDNTIAKKKKYRNWQLPINEFFYFYFALNYIRIPTSTMKIPIIQ